MDISEILDATLKVDDVYNKVPYSFEVRENPQTIYFHSLVKRANDDGDNEAFAELMAWLIPAWNIKLGKKQFPPTKENFMRVPKPFVDHLFERATKEIADKEEPKAKDKLEINIKNGAKAAEA